MTRFHLSPAETAPWRPPRHFTKDNLTDQATPSSPKSQGLPQAGSEIFAPTDRNDVICFTSKLRGFQAKFSVTQAISALGRKWKKKFEVAKT
jgi:hypothetical protein